MNLVLQLRGSAAYFWPVVSSFCSSFSKLCTSFFLMIFVFFQKCEILVICIAVKIWYKFQQHNSEVVNSKPKNVKGRPNSSWVDFRITVMSCVQGIKTSFLCPDERVAMGEGWLAQRGRTNFKFFCLLTALVIGSSVSLLWEMMLWLSVSVSCIRTQKGANLGLKCARMRLAVGLRPDPLGELKRSLRSPSRN